MVSCWMGALALVGGAKPSFVRWPRVAPVAPETNQTESSGATARMLLVIPGSGISVLVKAPALESLGSYCTRKRAYPLVPALGRYVINQRMFWLPARAMTLSDGSSTLVGMRVEVTTPVGLIWLIAGDPTPS